MSHSDGKLDQTPITLADCPVGLFTADSGELCLKTEYGNNEGRIDAYIVRTGEFFWGAAPQTIASQRAQLVTPFALAALPPAGAGEVVVPLEWRKLGEYTVTDYTEPGDGDGWETVFEDADVIGHNPTADAAKAAAQADYAQRILSAIEPSGNSGELPVPTNTVGGEVALLPEEVAERYERAIAAIKALPDDSPNVDLLADVVELAADLSDIARKALYASPDTTSRDSAPDLHEQADELWIKLMPAMQTSAWEDGSRDVYADKVAALAMIEAALSTRSAR